MSTIPAHMMPGDLSALKLDRKAVRKVRREAKKARAFGVMRGLAAGLRPGDVCIDCGAHYGEETVFLAATGATVHSFEPDPHCWEKLNEAVGTQANVHLHNKAVAAEVGQLELVRSADFARDADRGSTASSVMRPVDGADAGQTITVEAIDFTDFLARLVAEHGQIRFLKMDIEGAEVPVLEALLATDLLTHVNLTVVETHRWLFPEWKARYARLYEAASARPELNLDLTWI